LFFDELSRLGDVQGVEVDASIVDPRGPWREKIWIGPFGQAYEPGRLFDAILMLDVLEHLAEPVAALRHAKKLLAGGGFLLLTVPAFMTLWTSHDALNHHYVRYTRRSLKGVASAAGLRLVDSRFFFHWVYPAKLAVRLKERLGICPQPAPPQVPPALLNRALYGLTRVEEALLGRLRLPLGSSLLAVLR
jgi:SAM-dependent methyltransferase